MFFRRWMAPRGNRPRGNKERVRSGKERNTEEMRSYDFKDVLRTKGTASRKKGHEATKEVVKVVSVNGCKGGLEAGGRGDGSPSCLILAWDRLWEGLHKKREPDSKGGKHVGNAPFAGGGDVAGAGIRSKNCLSSSPGPVNQRGPEVGVLNKGGRSSDQRNKRRVEGITREGNSPGRTWYREGEPPIGWLSSMGI